MPRKSAGGNKNFKSRRTNSWEVHKLLGKKTVWLAGGGGGVVSKSADCTTLFLITLIEPAHNEVARNVTSFH